MGRARHQRWLLHWRRRRRNLSSSTFWHSLRPPHPCRHPWRFHRNRTFRSLKLSIRPMLVAIPKKYNKWGLIGKIKESTYESESFQSLSSVDCSEACTNICIQPWHSLRYFKDKKSENDCFWKKHWIAEKWNKRDLPAFCTWQYPVGTQGYVWCRMRGYLLACIFGSTSYREHLNLTSCCLS